MAERRVARTVAKRAEKREWEMVDMREERKVQKQGHLWFAAIFFEDFEAVCHQQLHIY